MAEKNALIQDAVLIQHQVAHLAVHLPDGTTEAEVARLQGRVKSPFKNHTLCVAMVIRRVEFPAILTAADPS